MRRATQIDVFTFFYLYAVDLYITPAFIVFFLHHQEANLSFPDLGLLKNIPEFSLALNATVHFSMRDSIICYSAYMPRQFRPSVRHTRALYQND